MGSCLIYFNTVIAGLIMRQMYEMLRHPVLGALTFMIYQETHIPTVTCGTKCYILLPVALQGVALQGVAEGGAAFLDKLYVIFFPNYFEQPLPIC